jgi:hypothetical protein
MTHRTKPATSRQKSEKVSPPQAADGVQGDEKNHGPTRGDQHFAHEARRGVRSGNNVQDQPTQNGAKQTGDDVVKQPQAPSLHDLTGQKTGDGSNHEPADDVMTRDRCESK